MRNSLPDFTHVDPQPEKQYELIAEIAHGGMATVFVGRLMRTHGFARAVAIKRMHRHLASESAFRAMFVDEALLVSKIRHPNVVPMLDIVSHNSELLAVMELVDGAPLTDVAKAYGGPLPPRIAAAIIHDVLCGLHAAHEMTGENGASLNVIHRDVSPSNILVGADGSTRILDFGIAKAIGHVPSTMTGMVKGKARYMAPEQLDASPELDRTADIFAATVVLWEMLTGRRLFTSERGFSSGNEAKRAVKPSTVSSAAAVLDDVVMRGLRTDPNKRFRTALEMARAIERALTPASRLDVAEIVGELSLPSRDRVQRLVRDLETNGEHLQCSLATERARERSFFPTDFYEVNAQPLTATRIVTNRWLEPRLSLRQQAMLGLGIVLMGILVSANALSSERPVAKAPVRAPAPMPTLTIPPPPNLAPPPVAEEPRIERVASPRIPRRRNAGHAKTPAPPSTPETKAARMKDVLKDALGAEPAPASFTRSRL